MAAINGVWFLWFDNLVIFLGMMRTYYCYILVILGPILYRLRDNSECLFFLFFCWFFVQEHVVGTLERTAFHIQMSGVLCLPLTYMAKLEQKLKSLYVYEIEKGPYPSLWVWNIFLPSEGINKLDVSLLKNLFLNGLQRLISIFLNLIFPEFPGKQWN